MAPSARSILDTHWGDGSAFFQQWRQWLAEPPTERPRMLHYVALVHLADLDKPVAGDDPLAHALREALHQAFGAPGPGAGHYRICLQGGLLQLTWCVGPPDATLPELRMQADRVLLRTMPPPSAPAWTWFGRLCKAGAQLQWTRPHSGMASDAAKAPPAPWQASSATCWTYAPPWPLRRSRQQTRTVWARPQRCTVVGAGLSGAATAQALALRGWQVQVLEAGAQPGAGASGVPAGLVSAQHSQDDTPQSLWTTRGAALMRQLVANSLLEGRDWQPSGASLLLADAKLAASTTPWNPQAFWMRPGAWIASCLASEGIALRCHARVAQLVQREGLWCALDGAGALLAESELVVLCNATDGARLLRTPALACTPALQTLAARLQGRHGSVSLGPAAGLAGLPAHPVHGAGHFLPALPAPGGLRWLAGAGFAQYAGADPAAEHADNITRVGHMLPEVADALRAQAQAGLLDLWQGERCTSPDRLPLIGAVAAAPAAGLWVHLAMGSRGLSVAALGAAWLAACIMGEPWPMEARLARYVDAQRLERKLPPTGNNSESAP